MTTDPDSGPGTGTGTGTGIDSGPAARTGARELSLAETFVLLADTLVDDYDVVDLLHRLVACCVDLLGVSAAGLLLDDQRGNLAVMATSSEETRLLEIFQIQSNEGPCLDCVRGGAPVTSADLGADRSRWPLFVPVALQAGFRSVTAVPLRLRSQTIGGLNLFQAAAGPVPAADQLLAQALADVATIGILHERSHHESALVASQLQHALNSRVVIEQAKGVLAERDQVEMDVAFAALRGYAREHNRKLTDVAVGVADGSIGPGAITARPTAGGTRAPRRSTPTE
jgi:GAF domain-containing protein